MPVSGLALCSLRVVVRHIAPGRRQGSLGDRPPAAAASQPAGAVFEWGGGGGGERGKGAGVGGREGEGEGK